MPRIRTIKPEFWSDEVVADLTPWARLLFIGTWNLADDEARLRWTPDYLNASLFMYDRHTTAKVQTFMTELENHGLVIAYTGGKSQQRLAYIPSFLKHQKINRPNPSKLPAPPSLNPSLFDSLSPSERGSLNASVSEDGPDSGSNSVSPHGAITPGREGKGKEGKGRDRASSRSELARALVGHWFESHDPRPPNDFLGVSKVVERLLTSGADPRAVRRALDDAPTPTLNALQVALGRSSAPTSHNGRILTDRDGPSVGYAPEED